MHNTVQQYTVPQFADTNNFVKIQYVLQIRIDSSKWKSKNAAILLVYPVPLTREKLVSII
jgi:hypothetical protein